MVERTLTIVVNIRKQTTVGREDEVTFLQLSFLITDRCNNSGLSMDKLILSPLYTDRILSAIQLAAQRSNSDKIYHT